MIKRILSTLIILAVLALSIYFGGARGFSALIFILALLASYEACLLEKKCGLKPRFWLVALLLCAAFASLFFKETRFGWFLAELVSPQILLAGFLIAALKSPYSDYPSKTLLPEYITTVVFGAFVLCFSRLAQIDLKLAVWSAFVIKFSDIGGYLFGCGFGRNKIAPTISPKKSWEGLLGGIFLSVACGMASAHYLIPESFKDVPMPIVGLVCAGAAVVALLSDLVESALKRKAGVKDSGGTLPGIGGALDLADSMILTAPVMAAVFYGLC